MGTIYRKPKVTRTWNGFRYDAGADDFPPPEERVCSVCGEHQGAAYWAGRLTISVCRPCALAALPALLADALVGEHPDGPNTIANLCRALETVHANFWKAAAVAIHRNRENR